MSGFELGLKLVVNLIASLFRFGLIILSSRHGWGEV